MRQSYPSDIRREMFKTLLPILEKGTKENSPTRSGLV